MASDGLTPRTRVPAALIDLAWWLGAAGAGFVLAAALRAGPPLLLASAPWAGPLALVPLTLAAGVATILDVRRGIQQRDAVPLLRATGWATLVASGVLGLVALVGGGAALPVSAVVVAIVAGAWLVAGLGVEALVPGRGPLAGRTRAAAVALPFVAVEATVGLALLAGNGMAPLIGLGALVVAIGLFAGAVTHASRGALLGHPAAAATLAAAGIAALAVARTDALETTIALALLGMAAAVAARPYSAAPAANAGASAPHERLAELTTTLPDGLFLIDAQMQVVAVGTERRGADGTLELTFLDRHEGASGLGGVARLVAAQHSATDEVPRLTRELHATMEELLGTRHTLELQRAEIDRATRVDALTGLPNRAAILGRLEQEIAEARRYQHGVAVLVIDIDHFGAINRDHGIERADAALRELALRLRLRSREADALGRLSGDSFLAVLPHTDERGVMTLGETLCRRIAGHPLVDGGRPLLVTVSGGAAVMSPGSSENGEALIGRAELALATAQRQGGDQVAFDGLRRLPSRAASG